MMKERDNCFKKFIEEFVQKFSNNEIETYIHKSVLTSSPLFLACRWNFV